MDYVKVTWVDTQGMDGPWVSREDVLEMEPIMMVTLGYLIEHDDDCVIVAGTKSECNTCYGNVNCIPRCCVRCIQPLNIDCEYLCPQEDCCSK